MYDTVLYDFRVVVVNPVGYGYTVTDVQGMWKGVSEDTKCLSFCTDAYDQVLAIANEYKQLFSQDSVAIQTLAPMAFV